MAMLSSKMIKLIQELTDLYLMREKERIDRVDAARSKEKMSKIDRICSK